MKNTVLCLFCICALLSGCGNRSKSNLSENSNQLADTDSIDSDEDDYDDSDQVYFLDFEHNVKNMPPDTFTINSIAKDITFIPLETPDDAFLQVFNFKIAKINERYYISSSAHIKFSGIMEFDSTGRFIGDLMLKNAGNGPNELPHMLIFWTSNHKTKSLVASSGSQILFHSFDNSITNKYNLGGPSWRECLLNDGTMVSLPDLISNGNPTIPYLHFRNQEMEVVHSIFYPQKRNITFSIAEGGSPISMYSLWPTFTGDALFRDLLNDTLYRIRSIYDINPYIVIHRGSFTPTIKDATNRAAREQKIFYDATLDTKKYLFVRYGYRNERYSSIWDKKTSELIANTKADLSDDYEKMVSYDWNFVRYRTPNGKKILINISYYMDGKLYAVLDAEDAMEFIPDVVYDDNPILMVINIG